MPGFPTSEIVAGAARAIAPRVSVFLFCRNRAGTIRRSVDSVLAQTYADFEYVIQDGASTDGTVELLRQYDDPRIKRLTIKASGCPNACGHHWIADLGFYGNARKIEGREVPYYQMLLGGGQDEQGIMRFGMAIQSIPARLGPEAVRRVLTGEIPEYIPFLTR